MSKKLLATLRGMVAVVLMLFATNFLPVVAVYAAQPEGAGNSESAMNSKVFVCKYVGTPHVDERLQTGQNPISVSVNSIQHNEWDGNVPGWFSDAHDRSYALAYDNGQATPNVSSCPAPEGPTTISVPSAPNITDPCGLNNATWNVPANTDQVTWTNTSGNLVAHTTSGFVFTGNVTSHEYGMATDSGNLCSQGPTTISVPSAPNITDPCGLNNATWNVPANTDQVKYILGSDGHLRVHTIFGFSFPGDVHSYDYGVATDSGKECKVFVCKYVGVPGVSERLQTGQNPISVSANSTGGTAVGSYFNDAQGRSFVLAIDNGQATPDVSLCPVGHGPTEIPTPEVPVLVSCGPNNDVYGTVPSGHYSVTRNADRSITLTADLGFVFANGHSTVTLAAPHDASTVCPATAVTAGTVTVTQPSCEVNSGSYTIPTTTGVTYSVTVNGIAADAAAGTHTAPAGATVVVTAVAQQGFVLNGPATQTFTIGAAKTAATCVLGATTTTPSTPATAVVSSATGGQGGDVLDASTVLANTGESTVPAVIVAVIALMAAGMMAFASRRATASVKN